MKCPDCKHELPHNISGCLVTTRDLGLCRCETKETDVYLALLTEAKKVIEPFVKSFKKLDNSALTNPKTEGMSVPYSVHDLSLNTTFKDWESTESFLKKLEDV